MSINNKRSYTEYTVTTATTDFVIGFDDYDDITKDTIVVTVNGVLAESQGYAVMRKNAQVVTITPAVQSGTVRLTRVTDIDESFHQFTAGALFSAKSVDENFEQVRHSQQEVRDGFEFLEFNTNGVISDARAATDRANAAAEFAENIDVAQFQQELADQQLELDAQKLDTGITVTAISENAIDRPLSSKVRDTVSVKDFGAVGVYPSDDTTAIELADFYCHAYGKTLTFPDGQYGITRSIVKKAAWVGSRAPRLMPFPQLDDDKIHLAPNKKDKLVGSSIIVLDGFSASTITTVRSDMFSSFGYAIKSAERYPSIFRDIAIVMDMDVFNSLGALTTPSTDNRVSVDVGLLLDDASASLAENLTVFGYFDKAGTVIWSHGVGDNPDYCKFFGGSTMGYHGLALIGNDLAAGNGAGLSGSQFFGFQLFGNDHHSRQPQVLKSYQTNKYGHVLFIDGKTAAANADINGHEFFGGGWRTYSNEAIKLNHCSNLHLVNVPFEFSGVSGQPHTTGCKFYATENTRNVNILNSRNFDYTIVNHPDFGDVVEKLMFNGDFYGDFTVGNKGAYVRMMPTGGGLDPRIQFTRNLTSSESGWTMRMDVDNADKLQLKNGSNSVWEITGTSVHHAGRVSGRLNMRSVTATLTATSITIPDYASYVVIANGGVAGTLSTITGSFEVGDVIYLTAQTNTTVITLKHTGGNIRLSGKVDVLLQGSQDKIQLIYDGINFIGGSLWDAG